MTDLENNGIFQELFHGDCLEMLKLLPENSVDSLITDPPAGISFMGKHWDDDKGGRKQWVIWMTEVMSEVMRVLKPGAHGLVWAIPRTSHWTATALEDAGFDIRDVVTHLFGTGFPKSLDVSKAIDRSADVDRKITKSGQIKPAEFAGKFDNTTSSLRERRDMPETDYAKQWQGWGTALKPASEHWILVRKPCSEKTVAANVLKWGTGAINIDASRIGLNGAKNPSIARYQSTPQKGNNGWEHANRGANFSPDSASLGRFPANLVLDEEASLLLDKQSLENGIHSAGKSRAPSTSIQNKVLENKNTLSMGHSPNNGVRFGDSGGASRFFYCAKASKYDKNNGLEDSTIKVRSSDARPNSGDFTGEFPDHDHREKVGNFHPTVKSTKLMEYFIQLITPPKGVVLDPFMGSGSTGVAAKSLSFSFIGIEKESDYLEIATKRLATKGSSE
jgi:site-specific DNA-methyltransferase (adenine-specific)